MVLLFEHSFILFNFTSDESCELHTEQALHAIASGNADLYGGFSGYHHRSSSYLNL